jgi:hypothetical protein
MQNNIKNPPLPKYNLKVIDKLKWDQILFKIDPLKGIINKNISDEDLKRVNVKKEQLENVLSNLELDTLRFRSLRCYTKSKYCLTISLIIITLSLIIVLAVSLDLVASLILLSFVILFAFYLGLILRFCRKRVVKGITYRTNPTLTEANNKLFLNNNFYMMPTPDLTYIALYQVPRNMVNMLRIKNYFTNVVNENEPSMDKFLHNRKPDIILQVNRLK